MLNFSYPAVAHPDLNRPAAQPLLTLMSLSKGNVLAIKKGAAHTLYNGHPDKGDIIQRAGGLMR